jgi:hypothetical protein
VLGRPTSDARWTGISEATLSDASTYLVLQKEKIEKRSTPAFQRNSALERAAQNHRVGRLSPPFVMPGLERPRAGHPGGPSLIISLVGPLGITGRNSRKGRGYLPIEIAVSKFACDAMKVKAQPVNINVPAFIKFGELHRQYT